MNAISKCIISLPSKVFLNAGAASKTNLLFFTKGELTREIWYYDLSDLNITKKQPLTLGNFEEFFKLFDPLTHKLSKSERSWSVPIEEIEAKNYDIKAVNPNRKNIEDSRTPEKLLNIIDLQSAETQNILIKLRNKLSV